MKKCIFIAFFCLILISYKEKKEEMKLPHPHLHERMFVIEPLAEIAGDLIHPVLHKTMRELSQLANV